MQPELQMTTRTSELALSQHRVLRNTYLLLALSLVPTVIGAFIGVNFINFAFIAQSPIMSVVVFIAVFYGLMFMIEKNKHSAAGVGLLLLFTLLMGVMLGPILQIALGRGAHQIVALAAGGTAAIFFGLAAIGSVAKRDFGYLANFLMIGFFVLLIAMVANAFLQLPALALTLSAAFILFSAAAILYTINQIVRGGETNYVSATLTLYVGIYNIFTSLLHLLLAFTGQRD
ncbi:MAG: Bax inhibitor-1/YccA family protein [Burkholderiales bacterium]|nr:Bax inhibitor-1/YccA family protein [Burkholderiales bacterium]